MDKLHFGGIEVSAEQVLVVLQTDGALASRRQFSNTGAGHRALVDWLVSSGGCVRAVMEATGLYGLDLALCLEQEPAVELMVANPRAVRHFAHALIKRSKTDPIDAQVLAEFARRMPFQR